MSEPVFMFDGADPAMKKAYEDAQRSFKYFWREMHWEGKRIVPALDMSMVKLPFSDGPRTDGQPESEHMWVGDVDFDGEFVYGQLMNSPNWLTSVSEGDQIRMPFSHLEDWMMTVDGRAYGAFTVNLIRSGMNPQERQQHDGAWGLDFGDPARPRIEITRGEKPKPKGGFLSGLFSKAPKEPEAKPEIPDGFQDHPMCVNMLEKIDGHLRNDPSLARTTDDAGWTLLHREALGGNLGVVKLLVQHGADVTAKTGSGRTAAELARGIGWAEIAGYLDSQAKA